MENFERKTYEISVENRSNILFVREEVLQLKEALQKLSDKHENCPGKLHALHSTGAGQQLGKFAMIVGMLSSLIASAIAIWTTHR